jgi:hypothetical protein
MAVKYTSIFHSKAIQDKPKWSKLVKKPIWQLCTKYHAVFLMSGSFSGFGNRS